ncbi:MAG: DegQ family serine endoprotease [Desulfomonile tiedjei]|nr:DegQ family serine endoprotease [Desulfomonile tiedjei]
MDSNRRNVRIILAAILAIMLLAVAGQTRGQTQPPSVLQQLDEAFVNVAGKVTPAVVNINSTKKAGPPPSSEELPPFFKGFPFREFFGDQFSRPRGRPGPEVIPKRVAMGSGVIVSTDGDILTNAHVVKEMDEIKVTLPDKRVFKAKMIGFDPESDIAVVKIDAQNLPTAQMGDSDKLRVGEIVLAIGNPFGLNSTVTSGIVSAKGRTNVGIIDYEDFLQTDAAINPGNSGGPLVNIRGEVVGIATAIATRTGGYMGVGFAIPSNSAKLVMDELIKHGKVKRGLLGINIQDLDESLAKSFGKPDTNGALVSQVVPGSPAEKAGVKSGDIVVAFNGQPVTGATQLKNMVGLQKPGAAAKLTIFRDKKTMDVEVTIGERTPAAVAKSVPSAEGSKELGIEVEKVPADLASKLGIKEGLGLQIKQISPGEAGAKMGLRPGDIILEIDGKPVSTASDFNNEVEEAKKAGIVRLMIQRGNAKIYLADRIP